MREFGSVKECVKCGWSGRWNGWLRKYQPENASGCTYSIEGEATKSRPAFSERIKTTCCRCGYTWYEKPKDAPMEVEYDEGVFQVLVALEPKDADD